MTRRARILALLAATLLTSILPVAAAADTALPLPGSMAAVGDSITQAASSAGSLGNDAPQNSWSTGTSATVNSHYLRLAALGAPIGGQNHNRSVSGARMGGLAAQMQSAAAVEPDYLTVLIGGNDLCTDTVGEMTPVADFRSQFQTAMSTLTDLSPETNVYVVSVPNAYQLWNLFKGNFWARFIWSSAGICQSLLARPTSTQQSDVQRRAAVQQRNVDYNAQLASVCAAFVRCRFDGNAAYNTIFTSGDVSGDYFHPSVAGQAKLASVSWAAGYAWATPPSPNQAPVARFSSTCTALACTFTDTSSDSDGTIQATAWTFGDGGTAATSIVSHTYSAAGTYTVSLLVTDDDGATAATSTSVTVSAAPPPSMWIGTLSSATTAGSNVWMATVTVKVIRSDGQGVAGATVSTAWSTGAPDTCTTGSDGTCEVASDSLNRRKVGSVKLTVTGVTHATLAWDRTQGQNTITVARPA